MRKLLSLLLLASYLLVVSSQGIPMLVKKPASRVYVHSKDCQEKNYLLVDCWDRCNGDDHHNLTVAKNKQQKETAIVLLLLDFHYHTELRISFFVPSQDPDPVQLIKSPHYGFLSEIDSPPRLA